MKDQPSGAYICSSSCSYSEDGDPDFQAPSYSYDEVKKMPWIEIIAGQEYEIYYCNPCFEYWEYSRKDFEPDDES